MANIEVLHFPKEIANNPQRIQDAWQKNGNKAPIFVHPWYSTHTTKDSGYMDYAKKRNSFMAEQIRGGMAPLVMEERGTPSRNLRDTLTKYNNPEEAAMPVLLVHTTLDSSQPMSPYSFPRLAFHLASLGIEDIKLSGELLMIGDKDFINNRDLIHFRGDTMSIHDNKRTSKILQEAAKSLAEKKGIPTYDLLSAPWLDQEYPPKGCLGGTAVYFLSAGFDVEITSVTYPHKLS